MKFYISFLFLIIPFSIMADTEVHKNALKDYEKISKKHKDFIINRVAQRQKYFSNLEGLRKELKKLEEEEARLVENEKTLIEKKQAFGQIGLQINREIKSFYQKFQSIKIDHNMNRPMSFLGALGIVQEITSADIEEFYSKLLKELELSSVSFKQQAKYVNHKNEKIEGDVLLLGNLGAYALGKNSGLLYLNGNTALLAHGTSLSEIEKNLLTKSSQPSDILFDVTGGEVLQEIIHQPSFIERIGQGGVVVYPILGVGAIALFIIILKSLYLIKVSSGTLSLENKIYKSVDTSEWNDLFRSISGSKIYVNQLVAAAIDKKDLNKESLEAFMEEKIYSYIPKLEKMLPTLNVLGVISPLLGLLGTVTGMIATFDVISVHGAGDTGLLSKGISEALITTQLGLIVAVPIILFHSLLNSRIENNINQLETFANLIVSQLHKDEDANKPVLQKEVSS